MHLLHMDCPSQVPRNFPVGKKDQATFLHKLALNIVQHVFLTPDGIDRVIKASGQALHSPEYCLCNGGIIQLL